MHAPIGPVHAIRKCDARVLNYNSTSLVRRMNYLLWIGVLAYGSTVEAFVIFEEILLGILDQHGFVHYIVPLHLFKGHGLSPIC